MSNETKPAGRDEQGMTERNNSNMADIKNAAKEYLDDLESAFEPEGYLDRNMYKRLKDSDIGDQLDNVIFDIVIRAVKDFASCVDAKFYPQP